ncbi:hypothetical protein GCM10010232_66040 [Streptomyces amakusaensis]|uniref:Uncharacterized protein n=1 Tax=Streptomyces amakusaensis TaxID=67271 RepID=A0ABW0AU94_9ACTN
MTVIVNAHQLIRLMDRTVDHIGDEFTTPLHGIRLEADATYLYAVASDRFTVAAARYRHHGLDGDLFVRTIPAPALGSLREWATAQPGHIPVTVTPDGDRLRFTTTGDLGIAVSPDTKFFDWRGLLLGIIEQTSDTGTGVPFPALDTRLLARFSTADTRIRLRATADQQAVLLVGEDFLGAQMPTRSRRHGIGTDHLTTPTSVRTAWQHTLSTGTATTMPDGIPTAPDHSPGEVPTDIAEAAGALLKQALRNTHALLTADGIGTEAFAAYATAGATAWTAYRYLDALHTADPHLAATTVADTAEQLESGETGEFAWDAATAAGHNPRTWLDQHPTTPAAEAPRT